MKIYTKTGDKGQTGLIGNERVSKSHKRIQAYGTLDELNSALGLALCVISTPSATQTRLARIQAELFCMGSELASRKPETIKMVLLDDASIERLEREIDEMETHLKPLTTFILPGGAESGARIHLARAISRRFERTLVELQEEETIRPTLVTYANRLADYLFVLARFENSEAQCAEVPWIAPTK